jgi:hypothetical protein
MRTFTKILAGTAGFAALAAATPALAQYYQYGYNPYAHASQYGYSPYGYVGMDTNAAAQQCTAAVQNRLYSRTSIGSILGSMIGLPTNATGRVVSVTSATPTSSGLRIRGLASSGRYAYNNYSPYGYGAYGALGYNYAASADLSFKCDVDYRGYIRNIDINRRF